MEAGATLILRATLSRQGRAFPFILNGDEGTSDVVTVAFVPDVPYI